MLVFLYSISFILLVFVLLPMVKSDNWIFRAMEYPRVQKWISISVVLMLWLRWGEVGTESGSTIAVALLLAALIYTSYQIYPYLPIAPNELKVVDREWQTNNQVSFLVSNVYQPNKETTRLKASIKKVRPDMVLLVETDDYWDEQMSAFLDEAYPFQVKEPKDNTYGMLLYSKLPLSDVEIKYMVEDDIPSIHAWVGLPSKKKVKLFCLHPKPPVPTENPRSTEKDLELIMVAKEACQLDAPVIVAGDLNDVAWSYTTSLFQRLSGLLDPRKGRGFFNTFHANNLLMRIPLDHFFVSSDFRLIDMKRLGKIGSDHFPIYIKLEYSKGFKADQQAPESASQDEQIVEEKFKMLHST